MGFGMLEILESKETSLNRQFWGLSMSSAVKAFE
jgi:hypothetical protein